LKMAVPSRKKAALFQSRTASREASRETARYACKGSGDETMTRGAFLQHESVFFSGAPPPRFQELPFTQEKIVTLASGAFGTKTMGWL
jgi:hypothetical protein